MGVNEGGGNYEWKPAGERKRCRSREHEEVMGANEGGGNYEWKPAGERKRCRSREHEEVMGVNKRPDNKRRRREGLKHLERP